MKPGRGQFDVWAPRADRLRLSLAGETVEMSRGADGWWSPTEPVPDTSGADLDYGYLIDDDDTPRPDPRSRRQHDGVHERSRTYDASSYTWNDATWTGRQLAGSVIYELHIGTFTPEGTFDAALGRLGHLREIGVDLVEVMPVNAFNGVNNWGYDGVGWFAGSAAARRATSGSATGATPPGSASSRTSSTTTSARPETTSPCSVPTSSRGPTPGATSSTSTVRGRRRCAATSSTTCGCGSRTTTSTAFGSPPCTP